MIGLIQHILFESLSENLGDEIVQKIYVSANIPHDRKFRMDKSYSDEEWQRILAATMKHTNLNAAQIDKYYAREFIKYGAKFFPTWFAMAKNSFEFLRMQPAIHNSIASGLSESEDRKKVLDKFRMETSPGEIITIYSSPNKHCNLFKELALELARYYGDSIEINESECMHQGADECRIKINWPEQGGDDGRGENTYDG